MTSEKGPIGRMTCHAPKQLSKITALSKMRAVRGEAYSLYSSPGAQEKGDGKQMTPARCTDLREGKPCTTRPGKVYSRRGQCSKLPVQLSLSLLGPHRQAPTNLNYLSLSSLTPNTCGVQGKSRKGGSLSIT